VVEDPIYNASLDLTPGITARLFIDLAVWGTHWDWPIWFPQMTIQLPPGGKDFACHLGTVCSREFAMTPKGYSDPFALDLEEWGKKFDAQWLPQCADETCRFGIRFVRSGMIFYGKQQYDGAIKLIDQAKPADPAKAMTESKANIMAAVVAKAGPQAQAVILEGQARKAEAASNGWAQLAQAVWTKQCMDKQCYDEVKTLAAQMGPRAAAVRKANPDESDLKVQSIVNKEVGPKFSKAVADSKVRAATAKAFEQSLQLKANQLYLPGIKK